jgi:hypothetical protein
MMTAISTTVPRLMRPAARGHVPGAEKPQR